MPCEKVHRTGQDIRTYFDHLDLDDYVSFGGGGDENKMPVVTEGFLFDSKLSFHSAGSIHNSLT